LRQQQRSLQQHKQLHRRRYVPAAADAMDACAACGGASPALAARRHLRLAARMVSCHSNEASFRDTVPNPLPQAQQQLATTLGSDLETVGRLAVLLGQQVQKPWHFFCCIIFQLKPQLMC